MAQFTHSLYLGGGVVSILEYTSTEEKKSQTWWHIPVIPVLGSWEAGQMGYEFKASLGYMASLSQTQTNKETTPTNKRSWGEAGAKSQ